MITIFIPETNKNKNRNLKFKYIYIFSIYICEDNTMIESIRLTKIKYIAFDMNRILKLVALCTDQRTV